jgi:hypothetical protein
MKWIRGKALQTVLALNELRDGDEVQVKPCNAQCRADADRCREVYHAGIIAQRVWNRKRPITLFLEDDAGQQTRDKFARWIARRYSDNMGLYIHEQNITAWRRKG